MPEDRLDKLWAFADDHEADVLHEVACRAGVLWKCLCGWYNETEEESCGDCSRARYETFADRLREARDTLLELGGDRYHDLADACEHAAAGHDVDAWAGACPPSAVASADERSA